MLELDINLDEDPLRRIEQAIRATERLTNKTMPEALEYGAVRSIMAGRARTPTGKKWHPIVANPLISDSQRRSRGKGVKKWAVEILDQAGGKHYFPVAKKSRNQSTLVRSVALIDNQGMAKESWGWMLAKFGKKIKGRKRRRFKKKVSVYQNPMEIVLKSKLTYLYKIVPGLDARMTYAAANAMIAILSKRFGPELERTWQ